MAKLSGKLVKDAVKRGAEAIVVACPMCHSNLDLRRPEINASLQKDHRIPVLFVTQLLGLALGLTPEALGIEGLFVSADGLLERLAPAKAAGGAA